MIKNLQEKIQGILEALFAVVLGIVGIIVAYLVFIIVSFVIIIAVYSVFWWLFQRDTYNEDTIWRQEQYERDIYEQQKYEK